MIDLITPADSAFVFRDAPIGSFSASWRVFGVAGYSWRSVVQKRSRGAKNAKKMRPRVGAHLYDVIEK